MSIRQNEVLVPVATSQERGTLHLRRLPKWPTWFSSRHLPWTRLTIATSTRATPWSSRTSITSGCRSERGRVVSRPGTGTTTRGAESPTTRSASSGTAPSRGLPSAVATSSRQTPERAGTKRPLNRMPLTARRSGAPAAGTHAAPASATLVAPVVTSAVPAGTGTVSDPGTSCSSGRSR